MGPSASGSRRATKKAGKVNLKSSHSGTSSAGASATPSGQKKRPAAPNFEVLVEVTPSVQQVAGRIRMWRGRAQERGWPLKFMTTSVPGGRREPAARVIEGDDANQAAAAAAGQSTADAPLVLSPEWLSEVLSYKPAPATLEEALETLKEPPLAPPARASDDGETDPWLQEEFALADPSSSSGAAESSGGTGADERPPLPPLKHYSKAVVRYPYCHGHLSELLHRQWAVTRRQLRAADAQGTFRVLTWNKLASSAFLAKWYCQHPYRDWGHRAPRVERHLEAWDADIIMLQEVTLFEWTKTLGPWAEAHGYEADTFGGACRLLVRASRFEVLHWQPMRFNSGAGGQKADGPHGLVTCYDGNVSDDDLERIATDMLTSPNGARLYGEIIPMNSPMAALRCRHTKRLLVAGSVHTLHVPTWRGAPTEGLKALQVQAVAGALASFAKRAADEYGRHCACGFGLPPIVVGGDFNSAPGIFDPYEPMPKDGQPVPPSAAYELLTTGTLSPNHPHHPSKWEGSWVADMQQQTNTQQKRQKVAPESDTENALTLGLPGGLRSGAVAATGHEPALTFNSPYFGGTIDYIFFRGEGIEAVGWLTMPWDELAAAEAAAAQLAAAEMVVGYSQETQALPGVGVFGSSSSSSEGAMAEGGSSAQLNDLGASNGSPVGSSDASPQGSLPASPLMNSLGAAGHAVGLQQVSPAAASGAKLYAAIPAGGGAGTTVGAALGAVGAAVGPAAAVGGSVQMITNPDEARATMRWIPNNLYPSDHLEIGVEFQL